MCTQSAMGRTQCRFIFCSKHYLYMGCAPTGPSVCHIQYWSDCTVSAPFHPRLSSNWQLNGHFSPDAYNACNLKEQCEVPIIWSFSTTKPGLYKFPLRCSNATWYMTVRTICVKKKAQSPDLIDFLTNRDTMIVSWEHQSVDKIPIFISCRNRPGYLCEVDPQYKAPGLGFIQSWHWWMCNAFDFRFQIKTFNIWSFTRLENDRQHLRTP